MNEAIRDYRLQMTDYRFCNVIDEGYKELEVYKMVHRLAVEVHE